MKIEVPMDSRYHNQSVLNPGHLTCTLVYSLCIIFHFFVLKGLKKKKEIIFEKPGNYRTCIITIKKKIKNIHY